MQWGGVRRLQSVISVSACWGGKKKNKMEERREEEEEEDDDDVMKIHKPAKGHRNHRVRCPQWQVVTSPGCRLWWAEMDCWMQVDCR